MLNSNIDQQSQNELVSFLATVATLTTSILILSMRWIIPGILIYEIQNGFSASKIQKIDE